MMKKMIVTCMLMLCTGFALAQHAAGYRPLSQFNGDTLRFLTYNFVENKSQYIGQPFEKVVSDYGMPLGYCSYKFTNDPDNYPAGTISEACLYYMTEDETFLNWEHPTNQRRRIFWQLRVVFAEPVPVKHNPMVIIHNNNPSNYSMQRDQYARARPMYGGIVASIEVNEHGMR